MVTALRGSVQGELGPDAVWNKVAKAYDAMTLRDLRVEAEFFGVSRAGPKAKLISRLVPYNEEYVKASEEKVALEDADENLQQFMQMSPGQVMVGWR